MRNRVKIGWLRNTIDSNRDDDDDDEDEKNDNDDGDADDGSNTVLSNVEILQKKIPLAVFPKIHTIFRPSRLRPTRRDCKVTHETDRRRKLFAPTIRRAFDVTRLG